MPGVKKKDIELEVSDQGFTVKGSRPDANFVGSNYLAHQANPEEVKAKFDSGLLNVMIPLKQPLKLRGKKVTIE
jgi:HSP20 family protein